MDNGTNRWCIYSWLTHNSLVSQNDYESLETVAKNVIKEKQPFERLEISKEDLLEMFKVRPFYLPFAYTRLSEHSSV